MWKQEYTNMFQCEDEYWWYRGIHELIEHFVRERAGHRHLKILDAGCGTGKLMTILGSYGEITGLDFSDEAIRYCRERGVDNVIIQDLNEWSPPSEVYDVVTCIDVLCHSAIRDVAAVLRKFHRCLKQGGMVVLNLPAFAIMKRQHDLVVNTVRRCRKKDLVPKLEEVGFEIDLSSYRLPFLFIIILARKLLGVLESQKAPSSDLKTLPPFLNSLLVSIHRAENIWISKKLWVPFGSSLFVVASKP